MSDILNIRQRVYEDNSIISSEAHTHGPYANTTLLESDEIRLPIQTQDLYTLPSQSYLYIEGKLVNTLNQHSATLKFVNNAIAFLFDEIRYELAGTVIDRVRNPGITSTMKSLVSYTPGELRAFYNAGWNHLQDPAMTDTDGNFSVCVPLRLLMGFCEDFKSILVNVKQELILIRSPSETNAMYTTKEGEKPKLTLNKLVWKVPHVQVSDAEKLRLLKSIDSGRDLEIAFRSWELHEYPVLPQNMSHTWTIKTASNLEKPRFVIVGFQTNKKNNISKDNSQFDHCNLTNIKLYLNSEVYPYDNLNINFDKNQWAILYDMYVKFQQSYYYKDTAEPSLSPQEFLLLSPLIVIDCKYQNESLKGGSVDIRLDFETNKNIPNNTTAYALIIHDRLVKYNPLTNIVRMF